MPSVRIAMELIDKSYGDFIRRLPIIILEDSILHPKFPFLVWNMVSYSKGFVPAPNIVECILRIVYDVASCPWHDKIMDNEDNEIIPPSPKIFDSNIITEPFYILADLSYIGVMAPPECQLMIRSILLRGLYGGMAGDISLLTSYAELWRKRFRQSRVPDTITKRLSDRLKSSNSQDTCAGGKGNQESSTQIKSNSFRSMQHIFTFFLWWELPRVVHLKLKLNDLVTPENNYALKIKVLCREGLMSLGINDVCLAGIDFHCSPILDNIVKDEFIFESVLLFLRDNNPISIKDCDDISGSKRNVRNDLALRVLKEAMWKLNSGVNYKLNLETGTRMNTLECEQSLRELWNTKIVSKVSLFAKMYVSDRLARPYI